MTEAILEAVTQWGMAGIALFAAGYVIWNTHKEERKNKARYEEKLLELESKRSTRESVASATETIERLEKNTADSIAQLGQKIDDLSCNQDMCKIKLVEMDDKINAHSKHPDSLKSSKNRRLAS